MSIDAESVKRLREITQAGVMDCKQALKEAEGNMDKAIEILKQRGYAKAEKLLGKETKVGRIGTYVHQGRIAAMVDISCETDFVAINKEFEELLHDLCIQVVGASPQYISSDDVSKETVEEERKKYLTDVQGKPPEVASKILEGKLEKNLYSVKCLLHQPFVNEMKYKGTVADLIKEKISKFGENIVVRRFARFELGKQADICDKTISR